MSASDRFERARKSESLSGTLTVLRSRWPIVIGVVLACIAVAVVHHERGARSYAATANVAFQSGTLSDSALQVAPAGSTEPQREADTEVLIAHSSEVAYGVRKQLHITASPSELLEQVKVEVAPNANVLNVVASTGDPTYSARLANAFAEQYIAFRTKSELAGIETAQGKLEQQIATLPSGSAESATLQQSLQRLSELRAVAGGGANIIGLARPSGKPAGSSLSTIIVIGALIGLALAFSIVFLLESLDRRIKTIEEFEHEYRLPVLASVPRSAFRSRRTEEREEALEPYRILRSALDFAAVTRQLNTLLVTSAVSGEGKTTVAVDLSYAVALAGRRVVLMEFDLRRPTFTDHFKIDARNGLTTALTYNTPLSELLVEPFSDLPNFSVLPSGRIPQNPSELLGSPRIAEMISELLSEDGIVIIDAPPLNPVADAHVLLNNSAIHTTILVARIDKTTREEVRRARATLDRHMIDPVGIVVTGLRQPSQYGYEPYTMVEPRNGGHDIDAVPRPRSRSMRRLST